jgi:hypothetical protein
MKYLYGKKSPKLQRHSMTNIFKLKNVYWTANIYRLRQIYNDVKIFLIKQNYHSITGIKKTM